MTPIYGVTENGLKRTGTDPRVLPRTVLYDPQLSLSLPVDLSVASGITPWRTRPRACTRWMPIR